jgi:hypothetical protein
MDARERAAAWDREHRPECVADVPLQIKQDLAEGHVEPDRPVGQRGPQVAAAAARILVDFDASPHGGHWRPLPDSGHEPAIAMRTVIHHSIVGSAEGAYQYFAGSTPLESTFIVKKSGYFWQCMSLGEQADANFRANAFAGSIETETTATPTPTPGPRPSSTPWSGCPWRCAACAPDRPPQVAAPVPGRGRPRPRRRSTSCSPGCGTSRACWRTCRPASAATGPGSAPAGLRRG